jgi:matrix metalloproteinase-14 (membrane-inserted)
MMLYVAVLLVGLQAALAAPLTSGGVKTEVDAQQYLAKFGYLHATGDDFRGAPGDDFAEAIQRFQEFAGLEVTGLLDEATIEKMNAPRCGVTDNGGSHARGVVPRYVLQGSKWPSKSLTYNLGQSTTQADRATVENELKKAFDLWSEVTDLTFAKKTGAVDIDILFGKGEHGDGYAFDGPSGVLAHAFFPAYGGDAHFDDAETYDIQQTGKNIHLLQVAAHEFGHSLGLSHSNRQSALMAPYYRQNLPVVTLDADDVAGIQAIYGAKTN